MWDYNDKVMDHFLHPRNVGAVENPDGVAQVGNMSCGDALKLSFKLDKDGRIADVKTTRSSTRGALSRTRGC